MPMKIPFNDITKYIDVFKTLTDEEKIKFIDYIKTYDMMKHLNT